MKIYDVAFYIIIFFLAGTLAASAVSFSIIFGATLLMAALFLFFGYLRKSSKLFWLAGLFLFIIAGSFYYVWHGAYQDKNINIVFNGKINFSGVVTSYPERGNQQRLVVELQSPYAGKILIKLQPHPSFNYGDVLNFEGVVKKPLPESYANYLAKDGILGVSDFPKTELADTNKGSKIKAALFDFKGKIVGVFQKVLPSEKAAFLAGITLGERAEFSKEFKEAMSKSGTTHLVALSGYNIAVLVMAVSYSLGKVFSRRLTFWLTLFIILVFVLMTGAEASVVRAAIMGEILLLAQQVGRLYSFRNAIAVAAFLMVLQNPKVLSFDIGFQLSFLALIGIVYLMPAIQKFFRLKEEMSFLSWRENFLTTLSAQLAVAPLLILYFGRFSLVSLSANLLILVLIPVTMTFGFILGASGFISYYFSLIFGWFVNFFLSYETFIIKFFGNLNILQIKSLNAFLAISYYLVIAGFIIYNRYKQPASVK